MDSCVNLRDESIKILLILEYIYSIALLEVDVKLETECVKHADKVFGIKFDWCHQSEVEVIVQNSTKILTEAADFVISNRAKIESFLQNLN